MTTLAERVLISREKADLSQQEVAEAVGMKQPSYHKIESGQTKKTKFIGELAKVFGVNYDWLANGEGEMKPTPPVVQDILDNAPRAYVATDKDKNSRVLVDLYDVNACCGDGSNTFEFEPLKKQLPFDHSFFINRGLKPENCIMLYAKNDSMEHYICDGDAVMIDNSKTDPKDGEVYAVWFADELMLKRIFKESSDNLILSSDNKKYRDREVNINNGTDFRVIGKVVYRSG